MGTKIRDLAKEKYPTITAFCKAAGITEGALRKWERVGLSKAQLGVVMRVAKALDCSIEDIYGE